MRSGCGGTWSDVAAARHSACSPIAARMSASSGGATAGAGRSNRRNSARIAKLAPNARPLGRRHALNLRLVEARLVTPDPNLARREIKRADGSPPRANPTAVETGSAQLVGVGLLSHRRLAPPVSRCGRAQLSVSFLRTCIRLGSFGSAPIENPSSRHIASIRRFSGSTSPNSSSIRHSRATSMSRVISR